MTVAEAGSHEGVLHEVMHEAGLDSDEPVVDLSEKKGKINADLTVGVDVASVFELQANRGICARGVVLHGSGFVVTPEQATYLGLGRRPGLEQHIRPYRNGRDLSDRPRRAMVIDLFGLTQDQVREHYPEIYQHVVRNVKENADKDGKIVGRDANARDYRRLNWWLFGENIPELRKALVGQRRYIATVETAKHRVFQFLDAKILPDNKLVAMASDDAFSLGILQSRTHETWYLANAGKLGVYERDAVYVKSACFDPFPFPEPDAATRTEIAWAAEAIDRHRKERQNEHPGLTLTQMYNVLERMRPAVISPLAGEMSPKATEGGENRQSDARPSALPGISPARGEISQSSPLTAEEQRILDQGLILILKELHQRLDAAVTRAYGWPAGLSDQDVLLRLVALNQSRAAEERRGMVRWLRPDYQIPRFGSTSEKAQIEAELVGGASAGMTEEKKSAGKAQFPADPREQTAAVFAALLQSPAPLSSRQIAAGFRQGQKAERKIALTLSALARLGHLSSPDGGGSFQLRRAA